MERSDCIAAGHCRQLLLVALLRQVVFRQALFWQAMTRKPCYRRENRAMLLQISILIEIYDDIVWFPSKGTTFLLVFVCRLQTVKKW